AFAPSGPNGPNSLIVASDGNLYGTDTFGGAFGRGTVYRLTPDGVLTILKSFTATQASPRAVVEGAGVLYGTLTAGSDTPSGAIFAIGLDGSGFRIVYRFGAGDGIAFPTALVRGQDGTLFGASLYANYGSVFRLDPASGQLTV